MTILPQCKNPLREYFIIILTLFPEGIMSLQTDVHEIWYDYNASLNTIEVFNF